MGFMSCHLDAHNPQHGTCIPWFDRPFDEPFDRLTVLSAVEGLTIQSEVKGSTTLSEVEG